MDLEKSGRLFGKCETEGELCFEFELRAAEASLSDLHGCLLGCPGCVFNAHFGRLSERLGRAFYWSRSSAEMFAAQYKKFWTRVPGFLTEQELSCKLILDFEFSLVLGLEGISCLGFHEKAATPAEDPPGIASPPAVEVTVEGATLDLDKGNPIVSAYI